MRFPTRPRASGPAEDDEVETDPRGVARLLAFSDGVFAIAITLLVLSLEVPPDLTGPDLHSYLRGLLPELGAAAVSFAVTGRFWVAHRAIFSYVRRVDPPLVVTNLVLLGPVVLIPFTTEVFGEYGDIPLAVMIYAGTIAAAAAAEGVVWWCVVRRRRMAGEHVRADVVLDKSVGIAIAAAAFGVSVPVALLSPLAAVCMWALAVVPVRIVTSRLHVHRPGLDGRGPVR